MTKLLDYILYVSHECLVIAKKINNKSLEHRALSFVSMILFFPSLLLLFFLYMFGILNKLISYNKPLIFICGALILIISRWFVFKRYKTSYYEVVERLKLKYSYSNRRIMITTFFIWFVPVFTFWAGMIIFRKLLYGL